MFCPHCGTSLPNGTRFCTECGAQIYSATPTDQRNPEAYFSTEHEQSGWQQAYDRTMQPDSPPNTGTGPLSTSRDIVMYILLTLVTCGIYGYWFVYTMAQDANVLCEGDGEETTGLGLFILLSIVTCGIYSYYWQYQLANRLQANAPRFGVTLQEGGSDVLIWLLLGYVSCSICSFIGTNIILRNMNTLCAAYNRINGYEIA